MFELTISRIQQGLESAALTTRELTKYYLDRIASIDKAGPTLNSIIELNPDALELESIA